MSDRPSRRYGQWAGNERGTKEDVTRCIEEVWPTGRSIISYQCQRKRGHGPGGVYCRQHAARHQGKVGLPQLEELQARGFDASRYLLATQTYQVRCSRCEALVINGVPCHETGCPNTKYECKGCSVLLDSAGYCAECG